MKYIDADKLKCLLDAKYKDFVGKAKSKGYTTLQYQYMADGIDIAEQLIDSLQQEQPEVDLQKEINEYMNCEDNNPFDWDWRDKQACARHFYELGRQAKPEIFDTVAFQKGVQEGRRLEREDALTIADVEKLHTFLYAVKNNKHGAFTFTRLTDEQYEEVLRRFNKAKKLRL